jgi:hypothetical protein
MIDRPRSFEAFWPHYLMAHRDPRCRRLHFVGSTGALAGLIAAFALFNPLYAATPEKQNHLAAIMQRFDHFAPAPGFFGDCLGFSRA